MKRSTVLIYTTLVSLFLLLTCYSFIYIKFLHSEVYLSHLPEEVIYPEYNLKTGEITNSETTNFREASDFVPIYGLIMYNAYDFCKNWGAVFLILLIIMFIPQLIYCLPEVRMKFGILNLIQLFGALIFLQWIIV